MRPISCAFISGHGDVTEEEFNEHYVPLIDDAIENGTKHFVVGDFRGADLLAQLYFMGKDVYVTIYHMFEKPRHNADNYLTKGGFSSDEERDAAMTLASTKDIAWVRPGKTNSCTEKNIRRRNDEPCQLRREPFFQCCCTCIHHRPVHFHCCTEPTPTEEQKKAAGVEGRCVCGVQKGWACVLPPNFDDRVYDNWGEHSCGCEFHTTKEEQQSYPKKLSPEKLKTLAEQLVNAKTDEEVNTIKKQIVEGFYG